MRARATSALALSIIVLLLAGAAVAGVVAAVK